MRAHRSSSSIAFVRAAVASCAIALLGACSSQPLTPLPGVDETHDEPLVAVASASASKPPNDEAKEDPELIAVLKKVSASRHLPIVKPVKSRSLSREALLAKLRTKMAAELPPGIIALQGESLRAIELVPDDYDFEAGLLKLLQGRIAGLYDPDDQTMYLLDDLSDELKEETLNHELVHALQDQSFGLSPLLKFKPGRGDPTSAVQSLIEGDATSAMFEVDGGSSLMIDESMLRRMFSFSTRLSSVGLETPSILQESLVSPYTDGFAFVQSLRRKGGWGEVDRAFKNLPETTEQILHIDKFIAREPAIAIADPTLTSLPGFEAAFVDSLGELGLRQMIGEWQPRDVAVARATGWGGDRYVVARHQVDKGRVEFAVAFHLRMDNTKAAEGVASVLDDAIGKRVKSGSASARFCKERPKLGPIAWTEKGADIAIVAGPYASHDGKVESASTCNKADAWLTETLGSAPPVVTKAAPPH